MMMNVSLSPSASSTLGSFAEVTCQVVDTKQLLCYDNVTFLELDEDHVGSPRFYVDLGVAIALLVVAGIISGLTVGVISLDPMHIEIMRKSGEPTVRSQAATVAPLVKRHHLLLVSLLLLNAGGQFFTILFIRSLALFHPSP